MRVEGFADARRQFRRIAVSRNTANYEILLREGFERGQLVEVNAGEAAPRMLAAGRVDAWFNMIPESEALLQQIGAPAVVRGARLTPTDLYLACSRTCNPDSVRRFVLIDAPVPGGRAGGDEGRRQRPQADPPVRQRARLRAGLTRHRTGRLPPCQTHSPRARAVPPSR